MGGIGKRRMRTGGARDRAISSKGEFYTFRRGKRKREAWGEKTNAAMKLTKADYVEGVARRKVEKLGESKVEQRTHFHEYWREVPERFKYSYMTDREFYQFWVSLVKKGKFGALISFK